MVEGAEWPYAALRVSLLALLAEGGVGGIDPSAAVAAPPPEDPLASSRGGGDGAAPPPAPACEATAPSPTPTNDAAARLATAPAAAVMVPTSVSIVLPTSPRTMRLAMNGINAIEKDNMPAVSARSIISLEPTKLFSTPFAPSTAFMLDRFTADMRT